MISLDVSTGITGERRSGEGDAGATLDLSGLLSTATPSSGVTLTLGGRIESKNSDYGLPDTTASLSAFIARPRTRLEFGAYAGREDISLLEVQPLDVDRVARNDETRRELGALLSLSVEGARPLKAQVGAHRVDWSNESGVGDRTENGFSVDLNLGLGAAWFGIAEFTSETTTSGPETNTSNRLTFGLRRDLPLGTSFANAVLEGNGQGDRTGFELGSERRLSERTSIVLEAGALRIDDRYVPTGKVAWRSEIVPNTWAELGLARAVRDDAQTGPQNVTAVDLRMRRKLGPLTEALVGLSFGRADPLDSGIDRAEARVVFGGEHALTRDISVNVGIGLGLLEAEGTSKNAEFEVNLVRAFRTKY
ncbi:hypothetical protein [Palleronia abyssalis]|uniref:hypothetical protein n=1 Tax=Palleronia abyssalis TaxID=1501240 RepID=UPI0011B204E9|nr:hypothetical protein [Palleronia abyssalis]